MGELIDMNEWLERDAMRPSRKRALKRMSEISVEIVLLESEYARLEQLQHELPDDTA